MARKKKVTKKTTKKVVKKPTKRKRKKITKKQVQETTLRTMKVKDVMARAKEIERSIKKKNKHMASYIKDLQKTMEALDLVQEKFKDFRANMKVQLTEGMDEAEAKLLQHQIKTAKEKLNKVK